MTVDELREKLHGVPGHLPVVVEQKIDGSGGGADVEFALTMDAERSNFPTVGGMFLILLGDKTEGGAA